MRTPHTVNKDESWIAKSPTGNPLTKFVNLLQTPEERRDKYAFCRSFGVSSYVAMAMRDWHWMKVNAYLEAYQASQHNPLPTITPCS